MNTRPTNKSKREHSRWSCHVQLNFLTAGRGQCWEIISCSDTHPASIIQRCVLLGDLIFFPSWSCPSSASANRSLPSFLTRKDFSRTRKKKRFRLFLKKCWSCLACRTNTSLYFHASQLAQRRLVIICQICGKKKNLWCQRRNLPARIYTSSSLSSTPSLILSAPISLTCTCQERFLSSSSLPFFSLWSSFPSRPSINVKMRQNVPILYLHPHSILIPSLYPKPFHSYTSLTLLITFLPRPVSPPRSSPSSSSLLQNPVISSLSSRRFSGKHPPTSPLIPHIWDVADTVVKSLKRAFGCRVEGWHRGEQTAGAREQLQKMREDVY